MLNKFPIFKRTFFTQLSSKINMTLLIIFVPIFIASIITGIFLADLVVFGWVTFAILLLFVTFFNIFFTTNSFNKDLELGVINLEVRSGYKNSKLFFQRLVAQKAFIIPIQIIFFLIWIIAGYASGISFMQMATTELIFGMLTIFIYEALISSFLLIFSSFRSGISTVFFGVIVGVLLAVMPLFSLLDSYVNSSVPMNEKNYSKFTLQKYSVLDEFDQIRKENKGGIIDGQVSISTESKTSHFFEVFTIFDSFFENIVREDDESKSVWNIKQFYNQDSRDIYLSENTAINMSRSYANDLIYNGLAVEFVNPELPVWAQEEKVPVSYLFIDDFINDFKFKPEHDRYMSLIEHNNVLKFISEIDSIDKKFNKDSDNFENSFFTLDAQANKRFSGKNGFDKFIKVLKSKFSSNTEALKIIDLVNEVAKFSYTESYKTNSPRSSVFDMGGNIDDNKEQSAASTNLWLSSNSNEGEKEWLKISSDGARVFLKIYFDILREYIINDSPKYIIGNLNDEVAEIDAQSYLKSVRKKGFLNPGIMLTSFFYNSGFNKNFQNSQNDFFNPFINYVYDFDENIKNEKNITNYLNFVKTENTSTDAVIWDFNELNNQINSDTFINDLKELLLTEAGREKGIVLNDIDFKYIKGLNALNGSSFDGFRSYATNPNYFGENNFSIKFVNGGGKDGGPTPSEKDSIVSAIKVQTEADSKKIIKNEKNTKADLYKFGKNDGQLKYIGATFNVWIPLISLISISIIFLGLSWILFNKRIIK